MDFGLTDEQQAFRAMLREFFAKEAPTHVVAEADRTENFMQGVWDKMAGLGLMGLAVPEEYGGSPCDEITLCIANEEIARASSALIYAWTPTIQFGAKGITNFGTDEQKARLLPGLAAGTVRMCIGLTEPEVGSDLTNLSTRAVPDRDGWQVNGQKVFTTGADASDYICTLVRAPEGLTLLLIPRTADGVTVRTLSKLSGQSTHTCEVFFEDVVVGPENLMGEVGRGTAVVFSLLDAERIYNGACGVGIAQGALDYATEYARQRHQFDQPIIDFQGVGYLLADMAMTVSQARLLVYQAAWRMQNGLSCSLEASMAKIAGTEAGTQNALRGMQVMGGYSYMTEYPMERWFREAKLFEIVAGTNQIQRNIMLKHFKKGQAPADG